MNLRLATALSAVLLASPALAHTGVGHADGLAAGLSHPLLGPDHLIAMLSVGAWSAVASPKNILAAPAAFIGAMLAGAGLSFLGVALPGVEGMVAASVLVFGLMIAAGARLPLAAGLGLVGLFAVFHGHAHAGEATGAVVAYVTGFAATTAAIHLAGIGLGLGATRSALLRRGLGLVVAGAGMAFLAAG